MKPRNDKRSIRVQQQAKFVALVRLIFGRAHLSRGYIESRTGRVHFNRSSGIGPKPRRGGTRR